MIRPLRDRLLVKPAPVVVKTAGGLHVPETAQATTREGTVVAVGSVDLPIGTRVLFAPFAGIEIAVDNATLLILSGDEVLGVVET